MTKTCTENNCGQKHWAKGLCLHHYNAARKRPSVRPDYGQCIVDGCDIKAGPSGGCRKHWQKVNNPLKHQDRTLKKYNITRQQYDDMLASQNGGCKICEAKTPAKNKLMFHVDHDHACCPLGGSCGQCVRGLLCSRCNLTLGFVADSVDLLGSMVKYLNTPTELDRPND